MHDKSIWFNDDIQYIINGNIMEYDMTAASVSVSEYYHLLDEEVISMLKLMPKEQRTKKMGLIQRDNKEFSKNLISSIRKHRKRFIEDNGLSEENILSLHSDAVIMNTKQKINGNIDGIIFRKKGNWSSYIKYDKIEMFYSDGYITYKGIPEEMRMQHTLGINEYLIKVIEMLENMDPGILTFLKKFQAEYMRDELPQFYYPSFGIVGDYKLENLNLFAFITNIVLNEMKGW